MKFSLSNSFSCWWRIIDSDESVMVDSHWKQISSAYLCLSTAKNTPGVLMENLFKTNKWRAPENWISSLLNAPKTWKQFPVSFHYKDEPKHKLHKWVFSPSQISLKTSGDRGGEHPHLPQPTSLHLHKHTYKMKPQPFFIYTSRPGVGPDPVNESGENLVHKPPFSHRTMSGDSWQTCQNKPNSPNYSSSWSAIRAHLHLGFLVHCKRTLIHFHG